MTERVDGHEGYKREDTIGWEYLYQFRPLKFPQELHSEHRWKNGVAGGAGK